MRLFDAILDANHRAVAGDSKAGIHIADFADELPVVALTCVDPRLNRFFPGILGLPEEYFIWLRNAGNIVATPTSATARSIALACAIKGGREIAIIGHTDCRVRHTSVSELIEQFKKLGIARHQLPEDIVEYFGVFANERQNVFNVTDNVRQSPLISPTMPVHGLMVDTNTGRLDWVVNGYETLAKAAAVPPAPIQMPSIGSVSGGLTSESGPQLTGLKGIETKIGEVAAHAGQWIAEKKPLSTPAPPPIAAPKGIPVPPRIEPPQKPGGYRYR